VAIIPATFGQANYKFTGVGVPTGAEVTWGFHNEDASDATFCAESFVGAWTDQLKEVTPQAVTLSSVLVKLGPNDTGEFAELGVGVAGTGSPNEVQPNMAVLVQKRTALGGRRNRGRVYWPCAEDAVDSGGNVDTAVLAVMQDQFSAFRLQTTTVGLTLHILHSSAPTTPTPVTALTVQAIAATQRRRLRR
jgi:hypothetical protein